MVTGNESVGRSPGAREKTPKDRKWRSRRLRATPNQRKAKHFWNNKPTLLSPLTMAVDFDRLAARCTRRQAALPPHHWRHCYFSSFSSFTSFTSSALLSPLPHKLFLGGCFWANSGAADRFVASNCSERDEKTSILLPKVDAFFAFSASTAVLRRPQVVFNEVAFERRSLSRQSQTSKNAPRTTLNSAADVEADRTQKDDHYSMAPPQIRCRRP